MLKEEKYEKRAKAMMDGFKDWQAHFIDKGVNSDDIRFFLRTLDRDIEKLSITNIGL